MTIFSALVAASTPDKSTTTDTTKKVEDPQDRFLKLLVTQMKNQDPLNPLDNAQVTSQIAQISTVNGIERLNASVQGMGDNLLAAQSLQASSMIGRGVLAEGKQMELANGGAIGGVELDRAADKVVVSVFSPGGQLVEALDLGQREAGLSTFAWDGHPEGSSQLPDGAYTIKIDALRNDGTKVSPTTLGYGLVRSVSIEGGGVTLNTTSLGAIPVASVKQII